MSADMDAEKRSIRFDDWTLVRGRVSLHPGAEFVYAKYEDTAKDGSKREMMMVVEWRPDLMKRASAPSLEC